VRDALHEATVHRWGVGGETTDDMSAVERKLREAETELEMFGLDLTARSAYGANYHAYLQARVDAVTEAQAAYRAEASKQARQTRVLSAELFDTDDPSELRELFDATLGAVLVTKGRSPISERVNLLVHGDDSLTGVAPPQDSEFSSSQAV
jgi:hypothetical protein